MTEQKAKEFVRINRVHLASNLYEFPDSTRINIAERSLGKACDIIEDLLEQLAAKQAENTVFTAALQSCRERVEELEEQLAVAQELKGYAKHLLSCNLMMPDSVRLQESNPARVCTCGFEQLLRDQKGGENND